MRVVARVTLSGNSSERCGEAADTGSSRCATIHEVRVVNKEVVDVAVSVRTGAGEQVVVGTSMVLSTKGHGGSWTGPAPNPVSDTFARPFVEHR